MKISEEMVNEFNETLNNLGCSFKLAYDARNENPQCQIVPSNNLFIDSSIINLTREFYVTMENFFRRYGVELYYNNTRSIFWSTSGWDRE